MKRKKQDCGGNGVGVMVEMTAGDWEGHEWVRKKYGTEIKSNWGCRECVERVWKPGGDKFGCEWLVGLMAVVEIGDLVVSMFEGMA